MLGTQKRVAEQRERGENGFVNKLPLLLNIRDVQYPSPIYPPQSYPAGRVQMHLAFVVTIVITTENFGCTVGRFSSAMIRKTFVRFACMSRRHNPASSSVLRCEPAQWAPLQRQSNPGKRNKDCG